MDSAANEHGSTIFPIMPSRAPVRLRKGNCLHSPEISAWFVLINIYDDSVHNGCWLVSRLDRLSNVRFQRFAPQKRTRLRVRKRVVSGKSVSVRVDLGGRCSITKKTDTTLIDNIQIQLRY